MTQPKTALEATTEIHAALAAAGLPRNSRYNGGEIVGWTTSRGSTGFSVRALPDGLYWHVVVSGEPHLRYERYTSDDHDLHDPIAPERLNDRIRAVFEGIGLDVRSVDYCGHQTHWDDDVEYAVVTARPNWLEPTPTPVRAGRWAA